MSILRASTVIGAAGAALFALACSEAAPPAAEGAFKAKFVQTAPTECTQATHTVNVGDATQDNYGLIKDGTRGANGPNDITCIVIDEGGTFYAEGKISGEDGGTVLEFRIPSLSPGATVDEPATGRVTFRSKPLTNSFSSPNETPCVFWFEPGSRQQVAAGRLWINFQCDQIVGGNDTCRLGDPSLTNALAVQNCDQ